MTMAVWTREEIEELSPFGKVLMGLEDGARPMTREEYDEWVSMAVGVEKPEEE